MPEEPITPQTVVESQIVTPAEPPPNKPADVQVTAEKPQEMEHCQYALIAWCKQKIQSLQADHAELHEAYELAVKNKWKSSTLKRHRDKSQAEIVYYVKMLGALESGYVLVPNMPGAIFTVRTDRVCPDGKWKYYHHEASRLEAAQLPAGEGAYEARSNEVEKWEQTNAEGKVTDTRYRALEFGELEMPFLVSKPRIMEATSRAMALKIFDEFMILPAEAAPKTGIAKYTRQDPIVLGVIKVQHHKWGSEKKVSFMIAWHIDTKML